MLNGAIPFSLPDKHEFDPELELYPINRIAGVKLVGEEKRVNNENRKSPTIIDKLLSEANREYASLKKVYLKNTKVATVARLKCCLFQPGLKYHYSTKHSSQISSLEL